MRAALLGLVVVAACGRIRFDATSDGHAGDDDGASVDAFTPTLVENGTSAGSVMNAASLSMGVNVSSSRNTILLVSVEVSANCGDAAIPATTSVTFSGAPLTLIDSVGDLVCSSVDARTELWLLVQPAFGMGTVTVTLAAADKFVHAQTMVLQDVDIAQPIRTTAHAFGMSATPSVTVVGAPGDLVIDVVGSGCSIDSPGPGQLPIAVDNSNCLYDLGNAGTSEGVASDVTTTMSWTVMPDHWQTLAASIPHTP